MGQKKTKDAIAKAASASKKGGKKVQPNYVSYVKNPNRNGQREK
jgi:hypothetical protein